MADFYREYRVPFRNSEGYADPTPHKALTSVLRESMEKQDEASARCSLLIRTIKAMIDLAGFDLLSRIEVRDRETGRTYR